MGAIHGLLGAVRRTRGNLGARLAALKRTLRAQKSRPMGGMLCGAPLADQSQQKFALFFFEHGLRSRLRSLELLLGLLRSLPNQTRLFCEQQACRRLP